ncbi:MAG: DegV family protein, partial [Bacillota bacterium]
MGKQIIIDSACDLPVEYLHNIDYKILPYRINFNGKEYKAGSEIILAEVYSRMRDGDYPKTSQVSPQDFK